jgi:hypothetical protein
MSLGGDGVFYDGKHPCLVRIMAERGGLLCPRADEERRRAEEQGRHAEEERRRAEEAAEKAQRLAAQLRALGIEPEA